MKWLDRRKAKLHEVAGHTSTTTSLDDPLPPDVRADITKALAPHPYKASAEARFFGVPIEMFTKEELIRIVSWVGFNSRDHKRDA